MAKMTADEAIRAIHECAYYEGIGSQRAELAVEANAAEAAIREAFANAETLRDLIGRDLAPGESTQVQIGRDEAGGWYVVQEPKPTGNPTVTVTTVDDAERDKRIAARAREELADLNHHLVCVRGTDTEMTCVEYARERVKRIIGEGPQ